MDIEIPYKIIIPYKYFSNETETKINNLKNIIFIFNKRVAIVFLK